MSSEPSPSPVVGGLHWHEAADLPWKGFTYEAVIKENNNYIGEQLTNYQNILVGFLWRGKNEKACYKNNKSYKWFYWVSAG